MLECVLGVDGGGASNIGEVVVVTVGGDGGRVLVVV